jgi:flagellar hook-associated protein 1 FlgK
VNSPQSLSGSLNGNPGDATNFARIAKLRDSRFAGLGSRTFTEEMADITADTGLAVQAAENQNSQLSSARINMEADRDAVSGVDINEEMLRMMEVERAYQAAARFITAVDGTLDDLLQMSR